MVIAIAAAIVTDSALIGTAPAASVSLIVKLDAAAVVGMPLKTPVEESSDKLAGKVPLLTLQE